MIRRPRADLRSPTATAGDGFWLPRSLTLLLAAVLLCPLPSLAAEEHPGVPEGEQEQALPWFTVDSGGATSSGGGFTLVATTGQPELGISDDPISGMVLFGGFWGLGPGPVSLFADGFESGNTSEWSAVVP